MPVTKLRDPQNGDMNSDGRIDARALTVMKCAIISVEKIQMGGRYTLTRYGNTFAKFQVSSKLTK